MKDLTVPIRQPRRFRSIRSRIMVLVALTLLGMVLMLSYRGYLLVSQMREQTVGERMRLEAGLIASMIASHIETVAREATVYFNDPEWRATLQAVNERRGSVSPDQLQDSFAELDRKWADPAASEGSLAGYLEGPLNEHMKLYARGKENVAEVFLSDRYGGLVASSAKTSDFYQADESWWQEAFAGGKGRQLVRDLTFDASSGFWGIEIATPLKNEEGGVLGIVKHILKSDALFAVLENFRFGKTGHAVLVNGAGNILFHQELEPLTARFYKEEAFQELVRDPTGWTVLFEPHSHKEDMLVAYAHVPSPLLEASDIRWYVFVDQSRREVLAPLHRILIVLAITSALFLLLFLWAAYWLSGRIVKPIRELERIVTGIRQGNWDERIDIRSGDEVQVLAESFNYTLEHLRAKQSELMKARDEIESLSRGLEQKVEERTQELDDARRATMNIMDDLVSANENLKKYTQELQKSQQELETQSWGLGKANEGIKELYKELEQKTQELERMNKTKSDFVSIVAHEIRNPLGVLRETISLILDGLVGPVTDEQRYYFEMIKRTGERLIRITNDLLDIAKIEAGKMELRFEPVDVVLLVHQCVEHINILARAKNLLVTEDLPPEGLKVVADYDKLFQVLVNLSNNAVKFTQQGTIKFVVKDLGPEVMFMVEDTGPGISKTDIPKVFGKFEQFGGPIPRGQEKGTGLGLAITKSIVEAHQGRIWVESEPGKGSRFVFTVPKTQKVKKKLGEILLEDGSVTQENLEKALEKQKEASGGDAVV